MHASHYRSIESIQCGKRRLALGEMYKAVVFDFLHFLHSTVGFKRRAKHHLSYIGLQVAHIEYLHLSNNMTALLYSV